MTNPFTKRLYSLIWGITLPFRAFKLILSKKGLFLFSLLPIAVTIIFYIYSIQFLKLQAYALLLSLWTAWGIDPTGTLAWIIGLVSQILIFLITALTFSSVSNLIASPFNDFLAEHAEKWATPPLPPAPSRTFLQQLKLLGIDFGKTLMATLFTILALLLSWVPILNIITFTIAFLLLTFQYISYPQTRRGIRLKEGLHFLRTYFFACLGFGASLSFLFAIPVFSSLMLPAAVVGGTLLVARAQSKTPFELK